MSLSARRHRRGNFRLTTVSFAAFFRATCLLVFGPRRPALRPSPPADDDATMFAAAAATATLMRSWGWDESPSIVIDFLTNAASFDVNPIFKGGVWQVNPT